MKNPEKCTHLFTKRIYKVYDEFGNCAMKCNDISNQHSSEYVIPAKNVRE
jgi:hypothetical protein